MKVWEKIKMAFKPSLEQLEIKALEHSKDLEESVIKKLDTNNDKRLTKKDFAILALDFIDSDDSGDVDIWEYIGLFVTIRNIVKEYKENSKQNK